MFIVIFAVVDVFAVFIFICILYRAECVQFFM